MKISFAALALLVAGCSSSTPDTGTNPNGGNIDPGKGDGTTAGTTSGSSAGSTAGTSAGTTSGTSGGTTAGTTAGTSAGTTSGTTGGVDATTACTASAEAVCAKLESCSTFGMDVLYGDVATCRTRVLASCTAGLGFTGTSATATTTAACAAAIAKASCADFLAQNLGSACTIEAGQVQNGKGCVEDAQCASTFCARPAGSACGVCAAPTKAGDACVNKACSRGTVCPTTGTTCVTPGKGKVGDACTKLEDCDSAQGVGCNTLTKKCIPLKAADANQACGTDPQGGSTFSVCAASGTCSGSLSGTCTAAAADGARCSDTGAHCLAPATCVSGKCKLPDGVCK